MVDNISGFVDELEALCNKYRVNLEGAVDLGIDIVALEPADSDVDLEVEYAYTLEHDLYPRLRYCLNTHCSYGDGD